VLVAPSLTVAPVQGGLNLQLEPATRRLAVARVTAAPPELVTDANLDAAADAARLAAGADAVSVAIVRAGVLAGAGTSGEPAPFVIGSVTKTFVAATVLQLVEEGRIELDQPLRGVLPAFPGVGRAITIRQLLDHTSGVADVFNDATSLALELQPDRAWGARELLATIHAPWHPPGAGWSYANTNYYLLGIVVEHVTGNPLATELERRFLGPMGLTDTRMLTIADPEPLTPAWATVFWASGAMASSATDLARWGDALYGGTVLGAATRDEMLTFNDHDYGLGAQRIEIGGLAGVGHTGLLDTYTSLLLHLPARGVTIALSVDVPRAPLEGMLRATPAGGGPSLLELATGR
jgi:CubicO group peptidase (beta-lactamase class C family)